MAADMFLAPIRIRGEDAPISGDTFDFKPELTSEPTAPAPTGHQREYVEFTYQKIVWNIDGSIDGLAVDPTHPNAEVDHSEFQIVKLLNASTPKAQMAGISDGTSNTLMVGEILPAIHNDGLLLPAVQDDGLLLPAVKLDDGSHLLHPDLM